MTERRQHCRVDGAMVTDVVVRVRGGGEGAVLNFSGYGALIAVRRPMPPGSRVDLQIVRDRARRVVRALVLRCSVRAIAALEGVIYETALRFEQETELPREETAPDGYEVHTQSGTNSIDRGSALPAPAPDALSLRPESSK